MKEEFSSLLEKFSELNFGDGKSPTLLEIFGNRDRETLWSRYLTFFLNPNNEHGLKDFVLKSFLKVCGIKTEYKIENVKVFAEYQYIDIMIHLDNCVIGIENKVNAELYNDLHVYKDRLKDFADRNGISKENVKLVVLSKYKIPKLGLMDESDLAKILSFLTYDFFVIELKSQFFSYFKAANTKYLIFLLDFIENIEKSISMPTIITNPENLKFFKDNYNKINELAQRNQQYVAELNTTVHEVVRLLNEKIIVEKIADNSKFKISVDTPYFEEDTWYVGIEFYEKVKNIRFILQFDLVCEYQGRFWNVYFSDKSNFDYIKTHNLDIPNCEKIKDSLDSKEVADFLLNQINEIMN